MGGHQSKQTVDDTLDISATSITSNIITDHVTVKSQNTINVDGSSNYIDDVNQTLNVTITAEAWSNFNNKSAIQDDIINNIAQKIEDKGVATTQFLDKSKTDITARIHTHVETDITMKNLTECTNNYSNGNTINISGSNNFFKDIKQNATVAIIAKCSMESNSVQDFATTVTTAMNQYSSSVSENPFAFITDTIQTIAKSGMMLIAVIFIVLICFVLLIKLLHKRKASDNVQYIQVPQQQQEFTGPTVPA